MEAKGLKSAVNEILRKRKMIRRVLKAYPGF